MKPVNIFKHVSSENFTRAKRIHRGVKIIHLVAKGGKLASPFGLYVEATLAVTDAINQYLKYKKEKEKTKQLSNEVLQLQEKINQMSSLIRQEQEKINNIIQLSEKESDLIDKKIKLDKMKYDSQKNLFELTESTMIDMKEYIEELRIENPNSAITKSIEQKYVEAISRRNDALSFLISEK